MLQLHFNADWAGFTLHDQPFLPLLGKNCSIVTLDASFESSLLWDTRGLLEEPAKKIFWHLDFGFASLPFDLKDKTQFHAFQRALDHFSRVVWPKFTEQSAGVILYQGPLVKEREPFLDYLNLLLPALPAEATALLSLDCRDNLLQESLHWLSSSLIDPFLLATTGVAKEAPWLHWDHLIEATPVEFGLLLPPRDTVERAPFAAIEEQIKQLRQKKIAFRLVEEERLIEQWAGLEGLYFSSQSCSFNGKRYLQGFEAAGGLLFDFACNRPFN